jgi:hypothetical protein
MMLNRPTWILHQVGKFVDGENAAVGARQQAVVHRQLVRDILSAARCLDRVDVADHVGDGHVRGRQLFYIPLVAAKPGDRRGVAALGEEIAAAAADRLIRIVVDFTALDVRHPLVEQCGEHTNEPCLGLPAQPKKDKVVTRQNGVDDLGDDGIVVAENARKQGLASLYFTDQVVTEFVLDGSVGDFGF